MKLLSYSRKGSGKARLGMLTKDQAGVIDLFELGIRYEDMTELIEKLTDVERKKLQEAQTASAVSALALSQVKLLAPIPCPRQDVICLGVNYTEHARESAAYKKEAFDLKAKDAVYFSKRVSRATAPDEEIPNYEGIVDSLDYEVELAVILGKDAKNVPKGGSAPYIFGYTILNDVSARNLQTAHKQWYFGKSLDGFTPMGPWIVTADEIAYPPRLDLRCSVNEELRQSGNTGDMIHNIDDIICELSQCMTLKAGTIISTGTPSGVGMGFLPPKFLKKGDMIRCEIEGIGILCNKISEN